MKVSMIGTGYVGLVTGACLSDMGNSVICVDTDAEKIGRLQEGDVPIYEPGLAEMVRKNCGKGHLRFTTDMGHALENSDFCFIAVGTPAGEDGSADLQYVLSVAKSIGQLMTHHMYVVDKSTVPVGTARKVREAVQEELDARGSRLTFDVISNPEFLKEGNAVADVLRPDRIIIGADNEAAVRRMKELYKAFMINTGTFICMDIESAEMTKYTANAMLATKISFMNEIANICERVGADVNLVRMGIGSDRRIGYSFIYPGCGYGGSCFPKDVKALIRTADDYGYTAGILKAVEDVNYKQKHVLAEKVVHRFGEDLSGICIGIWGLAFKPETDDMREATSAVVIKELAARGAMIKAYDPEVGDGMARLYLGEAAEAVERVGSKYSAVNGADALVLITEWAEFRTPDFDEVKKRMKGNVIFDGRNQYDRDVIREYGFEYIQIGVKEGKM